MANGRSSSGAPRRLLHGVLVPLTVVLMVTAVLMAYYNQRVFGNPLQLPYAQNRAHYAVAPVFPWQAVAPEPTYNHKAMPRLYLGWELREFQKLSHALPALPRNPAGKPTRYGFSILVRH